MSSEDSKKMIDKVTSLSGDLHHSVMMAKQFLIEVMIITLHGLIFNVSVDQRSMALYLYLHIQTEASFCV